tara:strand:- start:922 stop:1320 length:399 start_codon:yes stop_codon:yes gene_type:complete
MSNQLMTKLLFILIILNILLGDSVNLYSLRYQYEQIEINKDSLEFISKNKYQLIFKEYNMKQDFIIINKEDILQITDMQSGELIKNLKELKNEGYMMKGFFKTSIFLVTISTIVVGSILVLFLNSFDSLATG